MRNESMRTILGVCTVLIMAAAPAAAQDKPVSITLGGGATFLTGDIADSFDTGGHGLFGVTFNINDAVGIEAGYQYHRLGGPEKVIPAGPGTDAVLLESNHQMHVGSFNIVARSSNDGPVQGYALAGPGIYHRTVQITTPSVGIASVCDPYWLICYPVAVPVDQIVGDRSATDFGFDFGGGIAFGGESARFFVEARFHYVWGSEIELPDGTTRSANAQYMPITFGLRF
jgi:opacity protein-like surface antigen